MKNIPQYILDYLQINKRAIVPNFGVFHLENSGAQLNNENKSILPPSQLICFHQNFSETDQSIVEYIAGQKNISLQNAYHEVDTQTEFWKKKMTVKEEFTISELGNFTTQNQQFTFIGKKLPSAAPDFFGLEEIVFSEIKNKEQQKSSPPIVVNENYKFSRNILWLFLLIIPILVLTYFGFTNKELLFGQRSFDGISIKNSTHRIEDVNPVKIEISVADSAKVDSSNAAPQTIKNQ